MAKGKKRPGWINETTNTFGGITTPPEREDQAATDPVNEAVEELMDRIGKDVFGQKNP